MSTAGGSYLPLVVVMLRILRRIGSNLPLEVFLRAGDEHESYVCTQIFPRLNARCVILSEILDTAPHSVNIRSFQLKAFSLLFSSFEEVLFLDADSFPVSDPQRLFELEPYKSAGFLTWPDFWFATPSQYFFDITSIMRHLNNIRQATEGGVIMVSKSSHRRTLLIAAYYNYWGLEHYYPLLTQGGPGEGDKETWLAAVQVAGEPFYQVSESILAIGHATPDGHIVGSAMVHFNPVKDHRLVTHGLGRVNKPGIAPSLKPIFVHVHYPKFNPGRIYDDERLLHWENGTSRRAWLDDPSTIALFDTDIEKMYWRESTWVACAMEDRFRDWFGQKDVCKKATEHWQAMFGDET